MTKTAEKIAEEIHSLTHVEKLQIVDAILTDLDKPDPEMDRIGTDRIINGLILLT